MKHALEGPDSLTMASDAELMNAAITAANDVRTTTAPNPWVGAAVAAEDGVPSVGATQPPGGAHAEVRAIEAARAAGVDVTGATLATTLEPCCTTGRTGPCTDAIIEAGIARVLIGIEDPDADVSGRGVEQLRAAGIAVETGIERDAVEDQLAPYLHHRRTGRPYVVVKLASSADGRTAAPDGTSQWITGEEARTDAHRLRAESQAILVGAGTVRADDPSLTVRLVDGPDPRRVVLGTAPADAAIQPCLEWRGELPELLDLLGREGVLQLMVEGGANTTAQFQSEGLVDRYVLYVAPAVFGGDDARPMFVGNGAPTIDELPRGRFLGVRHLGDDLRIDLAVRS